MAHGRVPAEQVLVDDRFADDRPAGGVLGTPATNGAVRHGRDRERALAIDHGALRIRSLLDTGWDRAALVYGPLPASAGLALQVDVLNGLTTSQTSPLPEGRRERLRRWRRTLPRPTWDRVPVRENLAVGWFTTRHPRRPLEAGWMVTHRATDQAEAALGIRWPGGAATAAVGVQNLPATVVLAVREDTVAAYAASYPGAVGYGPAPRLRPLGILPGPVPDSLVGGLHQGALGEVDYRVDTRVHRVRAVRCPGWASWCGSASRADRLVGAGPLAASPSATGGRWDDGGGGLHRGPHGVGATTGEGVACLPLAGPVGLVRLVVTPTGPQWRVGVALVAADGGEVEVVLGHDGVSVQGERAAPLPGGLGVGQAVDVQVVLDGVAATVRLDGRSVATATTPAGDATTLRLTVAGAVTVADLEVHDLAVAPPAGIEPAAWWTPTAGGVVVTDDFAGAAGPLVGRSAGGRRWDRVLGEGTVVLDGAGRARVDATPDRPNPGRTIVAVGWDGSPLEAAVTVTPPGTRRGEGHRGRGGLALFGGADDHLVVNQFLDDGSVGVSVSAFLRSHGHEVMREWDAVWSNVGARFAPGRPVRLRLACDGHRFLVHVDDEPVLYRALHDYLPTAGPLAVSAVGLVANWEWGDDTGTAFSAFEVRALR